MGADDAIARGAAQLDQMARRSSDTVWPPPLDLEALSERDPEPPSFIIEDWLPAGYATLLAGHGGLGKSGIALHLSVCLAAGIAFCGMDVERRHVLYLSCEDRESVLHWRLTRICAHLGIDMLRLRGWLNVLDLVGRPTILYEHDAAGATYTPALAQLHESMTHTGAEVLVVDGVSDTFGGNENSRSEVKQFVNRLVGLIPADSGAVLLIGHVNRANSTAGAAGDGYSGSTGWHNSVRARWYLYPESVAGDDDAERTGALMLDLQKSNLGRTSQTIRFQWDDDAHVFVGEPVGGMSRFDRRHRDRIERDGILRALRAIAAEGGHCPAAAQGPRTAHHVLSARDELPESLRGQANRRRFWRHLEHLRQIRMVVTGQYRRSNRHIVETLEAADQPTTEGCANAPYSTGD